MMLFKLAIASLLHRRSTVALTVVTLAISIATVLSVELIRHHAKNAFTQTLSGTDLVVGARSGRVNLLLYSVFRIGNATNNISWDSYQKITQLQQVRWAIPISLGDSHKGYRVIGTTSDYFTHYRYGKKQNLEIKQGKAFEQVFDVVLGAEVAAKLGYSLGDKLILSHGIAATSFSDHDDKPFTVSGILAPTGTPVDKSLHVSLEGIEAIHIDWKNGVPLPGKRISAEESLQYDLTPKNITAALIGLNNRATTFRVQRLINNYKGEALMAILPGVTLSELWQTMSLVERVLGLIAALMLASSLLAMVTLLLATLQQRQREIAVLRAIGAPAKMIFMLIQLEVLWMTLAALVLSLLLVSLGITLAQPFLASQIGINIGLDLFSKPLLVYSAVIVLLAMLLACMPAFIAYRQSLSGKLNSRL